MRMNGLLTFTAVAMTLTSCGALTQRKQTAITPAVETVVEEAEPEPEPVRKPSPAPKPVAVVVAARRSEPTRPVGPTASDRKVARILRAGAAETAELLDDGPESIPQIALDERNRRARLAELQELDEDDPFVGAAIEYMEAQASAMEAEKDLVARILAIALLIQKARAESLPEAAVVEAILPELRKGLASFGREFDSVLPVERRVIRLADARGVEVEAVFSQNREWREKIGEAADQAAILQLLQQAVKSSE